MYNRTLGLRIGEPTPLQHYQLTAQEVRHKLLKRYGSDLPLNEPMISPADMLASPLLKTVAQDDD